YTRPPTCCTWRSSPSCAAGAPWRTSCGAVASAWRSDAPANGREAGSGPMNARLLPLRSVPELARRRRDPVSKQALAEAAPIVDAVRTGGGAALREYAERFGDVWPGGGAGAGAAAPLFHDRAALNKALARLPTDDRTRLERVAERIRGFAEAQYRALCPVAVSVPGGVAEH